MKIIEPGALMWSVEIPMRAGEMLRVSRDEASTSVAQAKWDVIKSIGAQYSELEDGVLENMWSAIMEPAVYLTGDSEAAATSERIVIDNVVPPQIAYGGLRLVTADYVKETVEKPKPSAMTLLTQSVAEEYAVLDLTTKQYIDVTKSNPNLSTTIDSERIKQLGDDRELIKQAAIKLAAARKLLRYGLITKEAVPAAMRDIGMANWLEKVAETSQRDKFTPREKKALRGHYVDSGQAVKNLQLSVWPGISTRIIGVSPVTDVMFYLGYHENRTNLATTHQVSFRNPRTFEMQNDDAISLFNGMFGMPEKGLNFDPGPVHPRKKLK
jgi:hypothetical protein